MSLKRPVTNRKLSEEEFFSERGEVIAQWPAKRDINLDEVIDYQKRIAPEHNLVKRLVEAEKTGEVLIVAHGGYALPEEMQDLYRTLSDAGCDVLSLGIDTYTRTGLYEKASAALEESRQRRKSLINGWPIVAHGVEATRKILESSHHPLIFRGIGFDARIRWELAFAGGVSGGAGTAVNYFTSGSKRDSLEQCLRNYQYVDRLMGYYESRGAPLCRGIPGNNAGLLPPSLHIAYSIVESLLSVEQGVKNLYCNFGVQGALIQDVAGCKGMMELTREYLNKFGYHDVRAFLKVVEWKGKFPLEEGKAFAVICSGAATAAMAGAAAVRIKTPDEGYGVPTLAAHATGSHATRLAACLLKGYKYPDTAELVEEKEMIKNEARAIVDNILEVGEGDLVAGLLKGIESGAWDSPVTSNVGLKGKLIVARDHRFAVRYLECGNLPFSKEIIDWNKEKIRERAKNYGAGRTYQLWIDDIYRGIDFTRPHLKFAQTAEGKQPKENRDRPKWTIVTGVIGAEDPHVVGTTVLSYALREEGFNVVSLGAKNESKELVEAAIECNADAMFLSTYAGMGEFDCRGLREMCEEAGIGNILIYLGGNVAGKEDIKQAETRFKGLGINRIYPPTTTSIEDAILDLAKDLGTKLPA